MSSRRMLLTVCALLFSCASAHAVIITNFQNSTSDTTFDVNASATDLGNAGQSTLAGISTTTIQATPANPTNVPGFGFPADNNSNLNDGLGGTNVNDSTFYTKANHPASVTFRLNTASNVNGYSVQSLRTIAGWTGANQTQANQRYEVLVSRVGSPIFQSLGTFTNSPFTAATTAASSTQNLLTDSTGTIAANVDAVRFNLIYPGFDGNNSSPGVVYREMDVNGIASGTAAPAYVNLVNNGSFETPVLAALANQTVTGAAVTGWSITGQATLVRGTFGTTASDGAQWLSLESNGATFPNNVATVSQTIATTPGATYQLDFDYNALGSDGVGTWTMTYNVGEGPVSLTMGDPENLDLGAWLHVTDQFTAAGSSVTLSFTGNTQQNGFFGPAIDNVGIALVAAAVPESASWAVWSAAVLGLGVIVGWRRRRTR